ELVPEVFVKDIERVRAKWASDRGLSDRGLSDRGRPARNEREARTSAASPLPYSPLSPEPLAQNGHLLLIGRRQLRSNNSWMHNSARLLRGEPRCTILMHPNDAAHRDLKSGQTVSVRSSVGNLELPLEISDEIMPGVVSMPHGWGHDRDGVQLDIARQHAGASINDLTDNQSIDALCGTAAFSGTLVEVEGLHTG